MNFFQPRRLPVYTGLILVMLFAAACSTLPPVFPGSDNLQIAPIGPAPVTGATEAQGGGIMTDKMLSPTPGLAPAMTAITGQVTYRQRIALQPDAVVEVELQDVSRAGAAAIIVGSQRIETQGQQVPIPFAIEYDPASINPAYTYILRARIIEGGLVTWLTANAPRVLTRGAPTDQVEIIVQQSANPQPAAAPAGRLEGVVTYRQRIALPPNAVVEVQLQDISRADVAATVIASQTIETQGKQVPIPFVLEYDPAGINPVMTYAVSARITVDGKLTWISTQVHPVLTRDAPTNNVEIVVEPVLSS